MFSTVAWSNQNQRPCSDLLENYENLLSRAGRIVDESLAILENPRLGEDPSPYSDNPFEFGPELSELLYEWSMPDYENVDESEKADWVGRVYLGRHVGENLRAFLLSLRETTQNAVASKGDLEKLWRNVEELSRCTRVPFYLRQALRNYAQLAGTHHFTPPSSFFTLVLMLQGLYGCG